MIPKKNLSSEQHSSTGRKSTSAVWMDVTSSVIRHRLRVYLFNNWRSISPTRLLNLLLKTSPWHWSEALMDVTDGIESGRSYRRSRTWGRSGRGWRECWQDETCLWVRCWRRREAKRRCRKCCWRGGASTWSRETGRPIGT